MVLVVSVMVELVLLMLVYPEAINDLVMFPITDDCMLVTGLEKCTTTLMLVLPLSVMATFVTLTGDWEVLLKTMAVAFDAPNCTADATLFCSL